jgi:hypothetical protein
MACGGVNDCGVVCEEEGGEEEEELCSRIGKEREDKKDNNLDLEAVVKVCGEDNVEDGD